MLLESFIQSLIFFLKLTTQNLSWKPCTRVQRVKLEKGFKDKDHFKDSLLIGEQDHHIEASSTVDMFPNSQDMMDIDLVIKEMSDVIDHAHPLNLLCLLISQDASDVDAKSVTKSR